MESVLSLPVDSTHKLLITGFAGAGKTTFLRLLQDQAPHKSSHLLDLDQLLLKKTGHDSIEALVTDKGWAEFRQLEKETLKETLGRPERLILSLGGGTLEQGLEEIVGRPGVEMLYLNCPFKICWQRLQADSENVRPLMALGKDVLHELYDKRLKFFAHARYEMDATLLHENITEQLLYILKMLS